MFDDVGLDGEMRVGHGRPDSNESQEYQKSQAALVPEIARAGIMASMLNISSLISLLPCCSVKV